MAFTILFSFGFFLSSLLLTTDNSGSSGKIHLRIPNLKNQKGSLLICLYNRKDGFPDDVSQSVKQWKMPVSAHISLGAIPPGRYAIAVMHDEDGNNQMTYNLIHLPKEGFGYSNYEARLLQMPDFDKAVFQHQESTELAIPLRY